DATLTYYSQGGGDPKSVNVTLAPNEVKALDDTLANTFGVTNDGGAVHITTATATNLIATARTTNQTGHGTYAQYTPTVPPPHPPIAVKVSSGEGRVTAYASLIDALTQDPTYVPAQ